ncbi:hypothetical protein EDD80_11138 [Anseongella ginsenosidimutans]|uniref:Uncharacterized protein n=1 Tax=Anseongella ginsenosidimutans TaxID=496056 RepID=A0A4V2UTE4_9SPHI|nr:hypothetical protein EDD80_11138 [Anseongella ginsenosidimutans]
MEKHAAMEKEYIRHEIALEMESLKFYQGFYLPIGTGIIILVFTKDEVTEALFICFFLSGIISITFLYLRGRLSRRRLRKLYKKL